MRGKDEAAVTGKVTAAGAEKARRASLLTKYFTKLLGRRQVDDGLDAFAAGYRAGWDDGWNAAAAWLRECEEVTANEQN